MFLLVWYLKQRAHQYSAAFKASVYLQFSTTLRYFDNSMLMHFQSLFKGQNTKLHSVRAVRHSNINRNAEAADSRASSRHKRTSGTEHKDTETEMDTGSGRERNSLRHSLGATGWAAVSPAHERCDCLTTSLSQESSPSGGQRPLYLPGLQGHWEKPRAGYVRYHAGAGGGAGGGMRCKKAAFQYVL